MHFIPSVFGMQFGQGWELCEREGWLSTQGFCGQVGLLVIGIMRGGNCWVGAHFSAFSIATDLVTCFFWHEGLHTIHPGSGLVALSIFKENMMGSSWFLHFLRGFENFPLAVFLYFVHFNLPLFWILVSILFQMLYFPPSVSPWSKKWLCNV